MVRLKRDSDIKETVINLVKKGYSKYDILKRLNAKPSDLEQILKRLEQEGYVIEEEKLFLVKGIVGVGNKKVKYDFSGKRLRIGVISDTHFGSIYDDIKATLELYKHFKSKGVEFVLHAGDIVDGDKVFRGQEYELKVIGYERQLEYLVENYPDLNLKTKFILGNHDYSFIKNVGADIGRGIENKRSDMEYLGIFEVDMEIGKTTVRLYHPSGGTAYAVSYAIQKYIESLEGGTKPNLLLVGHYHKVEYLFYRNVHAFQAGTTQHQTRYMRTKRSAAMRGGWVIDLYLKEDGEISRIVSEFIPLYK